VRYQELGRLKKSTERDAKLKLDQLIPGCPITSSSCVIFYGDQGELHEL
jgi:hypothetical protein